MDAYKAALSKAKDDLLNAIRQRDYWNLEIARLQQLVTSLSASVGKSSSSLEGLKKALVEVGFTNIVESILGSRLTAMSAVEVRDELQKRGYDVSQHSKNPLALIHQTLKRLADQGKAHDTGDGKYTRVMPFFGKY